MKNDILLFFDHANWSNVGKCCPEFGQFCCEIGLKATFWNYTAEQQAPKCLALNEYNGINSNNME